MFTEKIYELGERLGLSAAYTDLLSNLTMIVFLLILCVIADLISKRILLRALRKIGKTTKSTWDDRLIERGVFNRLAHISPAIIAHWGIPALLNESSTLSIIAMKIALAYMIIVISSVILAALEATNDIYREFPISKDRPIKGYLQIVKMLIVAAGIILVSTTILNINPVGVISGLGAMSAVLLLIFKDSIMGLVASVNLAMNNMVRIGDWIEMPKYGADGDVIEITLQTIMVQNFDKTIVSIPIYALISDSFKNWRGMSESAGRRIKRAISIDMSSVHFLSDAETTHFKEKSIIRDYLSAKEIDILKYQDVTKGKPVPERRLTNLGTFRAYVLEYLAAHNDISNSMTFIVNQLAPTSEGVPIQVYVFCTKQEWREYEIIQSDIFDHLIAIVPEFNLRIFQKPSGADFADRSL